MLVDYTSAKGDKLQAALFLPANYEKGKSYPTVVYIYEQMSQTRTIQFRAADGERLQPRRATRATATRCFMPDITYNDQRPGDVGGVVRGAGRARPRSRRASSIRSASASPATRGAATRRRS